MARSQRRRARASSREIAVARAALAVIALRVLDAAFVQREPGTAAGDHLASGLVPAAILLGLAIAWPRLPAWWQAVLAGGVGVLTLLAAAGVSARHVVIDGLGAGDVSGILAAWPGRRSRAAPCGPPRAHGARARMTPRSGAAMRVEPCWPSRSRSSPCSSPRRSGSRSSRPTGPARRCSRRISAVRTSA